MSDIRKVGPPLGLQTVNDSMSVDERCAIGVSNIELLLDLEWRSNLLLGSELSRMKYSGDFTRDTVWNAEDKGKGWAEWLSRRKFRTGDADKPMSDHSANALIMWSVLYACFADENQRRADRGQLPLPLPTSISQLRPYASLMRRVDDWKPPALNQPGAPSVPFEMEPPFEDKQSEVIAAWEAAWETLPPDKRIRKGPSGKPEPAPPTEHVSRQYFAEREGLKQLKQREERELEEARQPALTIGAKPVSPERQQAAAAPPPRAERKPAPPRKTEAEIKAEQRAYQVQQDARDYRLKLMNLQQSADSLRAFLKNVLAREGSESYLSELRGLDLGIYSVGKDIELLRGSVTTLQEVFKLATEPYTPPSPMPRSADVTSDVTIDV
jgi:hypothetical protein